MIGKLSDFMAVDIILTLTQNHPEEFQILNNFLDNIFLLFKKKWNNTNLRLT